MIRHRHKPLRRGEPPGGRWEIIYTGFILILLSFFIMLASFSTMEKPKLLAFVHSFTDAVSLMPGGKNLEPGKQVLPESPPMVSVGDPLANVRNVVEESIRNMQVTGAVAMVPRSDGLAIRMVDTVAFSTGSADITSRVKPLLDAIAKAVAKTGLRVVIEGYTDDMPIHTWRFPSNWELSTARATDVLRYFIQHDGLDARQVSAVGYGEYRPIVPNTTAANRARNRRVEIVIRPPAKGAGGTEGP